MYLAIAIRLLSGEKPVPTIVPSALGRVTAFSMTAPCATWQERANAKRPCSNTLSHIIDDIRNRDLLPECDQSQHRQSRAVGLGTRAGGCAWKPPSSKFVGARYCENRY